jgi:hypothetical protein
MTKKKKKPIRKKQSAGKKKSAGKTNKKTNKKKAIGRKAAARSKKASRAKRRSPEATVKTQERPPRLTSIDVPATSRRRNVGRTAGQSGDLQGLSDTEQADSESVEELLEEGQAFEAGVVGGVEEADADQGEVRTKEVLEDDVPREYLDKD